MHVRVSRQSEPSRNEPGGLLSDRGAIEGERDGLIK